MLNDPQTPNEGPSDVMDRFLKLLENWKDDNRNELAECNDLRIAFHMGIEYAKETFDNSPLPPSHDDAIWEALLKKN